MAKIEKHLHKVRYRNDGDDFHILWAARRILHLIDTRDDLVAVSIEGISKREESGTDAGLLVVDMTEYFGDEVFEKARKVNYCQLKHSTTDKTKSWSVSELGDMIQGFAKRFNDLVKIHGLESVHAKARFQFITNCPISDNVLAALQAGVNEKANQLTGHTAKAFNSLKKIYGNNDENFSAFLRLLILDGKKGDRHGQEVGLEQDIQRLTADFDADVRLRLKHLIHKMTLSEHRDDPTIRKHDLFAALGIVNEKQLFPAPSRFEFDGVALPREQELDIVKDILASKFPVVIHATGGIGKSVLAKRLPDLMPKGSECIIFDGFAGGEYKMDRIPRHQHRYGLVQIANELAARGLCDPLLPSSAQPSAYLEAFRIRLKQAALSVQSNSPDALVLIIIDAADNSVRASLEHHDSTFVHGLVQEPPPDGCRMVAISRTEHLNELNLPETFCEIKLKPFSLTESTKHLRQKFQDADDTAVLRFHQLTTGNPRVQSYEMARANNLSEIMINLGPNGRKVDDVIAEQVYKALDHIRRHSINQTDIDRLCLALAVLPPMVPIRLLSKVADIQEEAIRSFVADMGHPFLIRDDSVQFRDEPVETWFRKKFIENADFGGLANKLSPFAGTDPYVAITLPRVLFYAGRYEELMSLALRDDGPEDESVIERREIVLRRVQYAMRAMLRKGRIKDVMKLLLRAAEEVASKNRQGEFLLKNGDLVACLVEPGILLDLVFRKHASYWSDIRLAYRAVILASHPQYRAEAYGFFHQAKVWLKDWSLLPDEERQEQALTNEDIARFVLTAFRLAGAKAALDELKRWRPKSLMFDVGRIIVRSLIDLNGENSVKNLYQSAQGQIRLLLAAVIELDEISKFIPLVEGTRIAQVLLRLKQEKIKRKERGFSQTQMAIIAVAESLAFHGQIVLGHNLLERYFPELPIYLSLALNDEADSRILIPRAYTLLAAFRGEDITPENLIPEAMKEKHNHERNRRELNKCYSVLLPWFKIRAKVITGQLKGKELEECLSVLSTNRKDDYEERAYGLQDLNQVIARTWMSTLVIGGIATEDKIISIENWLVSRRSFVHIPTWTHLARMAAHYGDASGATLKLAAKAAAIVEAEHMPATQAAECYANLAKAVLPVSREDAQAYLDRSFEILDRLDDEARHRLDLLFTLAYQAGKECTVEPKEAYRIARVTELIHAYDDHKFPWHNAASSLAELCPSSAIAIISRWRDRGQGRLAETLPETIKRLAEKNQIASGIVIALNVLGQHWHLDEVVNTILRNEKDPHLRQNILEMLERDLEIEGCSDHTTRGLLSVIQSFGMTSNRIAKMIVPQNEKIENETKNAVNYVTTKSDKEIDWSSILDNAIFVTSEEVDQTVRTFREKCNYYPWEELYKRMRHQVPVSKRSDHIIALTSSHELNTRQILDTLIQSHEEWHESPSVKKIIPKVISSLLDRCGISVLSPYLLSRDITNIATLADQPRHQILNKLLDVATNQIDEIFAEGLQALVMEYSEHLTSLECLDILRFALDRFEPLLTEEDGDGPWTPDKNPNCTLPEAVAGMLWAFLAAPESELRWKAAHAVRRLCKLKQKDVIDALIVRLGDSKCNNFTDKRFPFYHMNAQLYAFIAFARAAQETQEVLLPYAQTFVEYTVQEPPHVLIRHFASQTAMALEESHPGTSDPETLRVIQVVNKSPHPKMNRERYSPIPDKGEKHENKRFVFHYDIEDSWFITLAGSFNNVTKSDVANRAEAWIVDKWGINNAWKWEDDPRAKMGLYREMSTWPGNYSYPSVHNYSFYLTLHSMFCVAGQLLQEKQIVIDDYHEDLWEHWLKGHILTRKDGSWLADRRDPIPHMCRWRKNDASNSDWLWAVNIADFDNVLWLVGKKDPEMVVWGNWQISNGYSWYESIDIDSALVSQNTSLALLRALQTCTNPYNYRIPWAKDESEIHNEGYQMEGWIVYHEKEGKLDAQDPLSGDIPYPPFAPSPEITQLIQLDKSTDERFWRRKRDNSIVMQSEIWGTWTKEERALNPAYGRRLIAKIDFILEMLARRERDLIINVKIRRDSTSEKEHNYVLPYTRIFVLKPNGTLHTLKGHRRIGVHASKGVGA